MAFFRLWFPGWKKMLSLVIFPLFFAACSYEEDYQLTVCEDRLVQLTAIQSADNVSLIDEADIPQTTEGDLRIEQFFTQPTSQDLNTVTQVETNGKFFWQESELPLTVLDALCYSDDFNCYEFSSPNETLLSSQTNSSGTGEASQVALDLTYLNELGEERHLLTNLQFTTMDAVLDLVEFTCHMHCGNSTNSLLAENVVSRICLVDCDNGQTFNFEYTSTTDLFATRDDIAVFNQVFEPNCQLDTISADLPKIVAPFN